MTKKQEITKKQSAKELEQFTNPNNLSIGRYARGIMSGQWRNADPEREVYTVNTTGTQSLIPSDMLAEVFDYLFNASVVLNGGGRVIPMQGNSLTLSRIKERPQAIFKAEGEPGVKTSMGLEPVTLYAKTAFILLDATVEAIRSATNLEDVTIEVIGNALGEMIDYNFLYGQGDGSPEAIEPQGILTLSDLPRLDATTLTGGYAPLVRALRMARENNANPTHIVMNSATWEVFESLVDAAGQPLQMPQSLQALTWSISEQVEDGQALVYSPSDVIVGVQEHMMLDVSRTGDSNMLNGTQSHRLMSFLDVALPLPKQMVLVEGLATSEQ